MVPLNFLLTFIRICVIIITCWYRKEKSRTDYSYVLLKIVNCGLRKAEADY